MRKNRRWSLVQAIIEEAFERRADITPRNVEPKVKDAVMAVKEDW